MEDLEAEKKKAEKKTVEEKEAQERKKFEGFDLLFCFSITFICILCTTFKENIEESAASKSCFYHLMAIYPA